MTDAPSTVPTVASVLRKNTFVLSFVYSIPFGLLLYFNSSFLVGRGFSEQNVGFILASGYILCVLITFALPYLLRIFGNRTLFISGLALCGALFLLVSITANPSVVAILLPIGIGIATSLYVLLDIFLAATSRDVTKVGGRRGIFTTLRNGAYVVAQLIAIGVLAYASLAHLYLLAAAVFFLVMIAVVFLFRQFHDPVYERYEWVEVGKRLIGSKDLRNVFIIEFLLRLFYSIMIVYTPLYLHQQVGISFESMGLIFAIMIVPFLLLEIPVGRMEDMQWGEQEVLIAGFLIISIATIALAFITTPAVFVWAAALFVTRIGAALLEIGSEAYFFKKVCGGDSGEVSAFRVLFPLAYIVGPLLGALLLFVLPLQYVFVALGLTMLIGIFSACALTDTK